MPSFSSLFSMRSHANNGKTVMTMKRDSDSVNTNNGDDDNGYNGKSKSIV